MFVSLFFPFSFFCSFPFLLVWLGFLPYRHDSILRLVYPLSRYFPMNNVSTCASTSAGSILPISHTWKYTVLTTVVNSQFNGYFNRISKSHFDVPFFLFLFPSASSYVQRWKVTVIYITTALWYTSWRFFHLLLAISSTVTIADQW